VEQFQEMLQFERREKLSELPGEFAKIGSG